MIRPLLLLIVSVYLSLVLNSYIPCHLILCLASHRVNPRKMWIRGTGACPHHCSGRCVVRLVEGLGKPYVWISNAFTTRFIDTICVARNWLPSTEYRRACFTWHRASPRKLWIRGTGACPHHCSGRCGLSHTFHTH